MLCALQQKGLAGIFGPLDEPLVSKDFNGDSRLFHYRRPFHHGYGREHVVEGYFLVRQRAGLFLPRCGSCDLHRPERAVRKRGVCHELGAEGPGRKGKRVFVRADFNVPLGWR